MQSHYLFLLQECIFQLVMVHVMCAFWVHCSACCERLSCTQCNACCVVYYVLVVHTSKTIACLVLWYECMTMIVWHHRYRGNLIHPRRKFRLSASHPRKKSKVQKRCFSDTVATLATCVVFVAPDIAQCAFLAFCANYIVPTSSCAEFDSCCRDHCGCRSWSCRGEF